MDSTTESTIGAAPTGQPTDRSPESTPEFENNSPQADTTGEDTIEVASNSPQEDTTGEDTIKVASTDPTEDSTESTDNEAPRRSGRSRRPVQRYEGAYIAIEGSDIPRSYTAAIASRDREAWVKATVDKITKLQTLNTWKVVDLPTGKHPIGSRWVFTLKYTPTGLIDRYKARLVAQGFSQKEGDDY